MLIAVKNLNPCSKKLSIIIKCPKCGEVGRLVVKAKYYDGNRKYMVLHEKRRCIITWFDSCWEEVDRIYRSIKG